MNKATGLLNVHDHVRIMLDAMPFCCHLWNREGQLIDCNEAANIEFFKVRNKQEVLDNFFALSPKYQPDGQRSDKKADLYLKKAFEEGAYTFDWMHQTMDGTPLPSEITLVRVRYEHSDVVVSHTHDLREHRRMMLEIEQRDELLATVNRAAAVLIQSASNNFHGDLQHCMAALATGVDFDRTSIWKNRVADGKLYCSQIHLWAGGAIGRNYKGFPQELAYGEHFPGWKKTLSRGENIHSLVRDLSAPTRELLSSRDMRSVFVVPVFLRDQLWGMITYGNCHNDRMLSLEEQAILRSGSLMIFNALLRHEMERDLRAASAKLEAVVANYSGIIWSANKDRVITLYKGAYLEKLGKKSLHIEGQTLDAYFNRDKHLQLLENIQKTFVEGAQDWLAEINGITYHARTTPIADDSGQVTDIVGSFDDITELSWLQEELKNALRAAQEANRAKDTFLAKMSHEMRTPLNAVIGLSELLLQNKEITGQCYLDIEKVSNAGTTLLNLVNDLLDISKIEAGKFELVPAQYDIPSLLNDAITQSILYIGEKPVRFVLDIDATLPLRLYGDALRVKQILNNLLSNAFKYTREGVVKLSVHCVRNHDAVWMTVQVRDTGIGIRPEDMGRLFTDYVQLEGHSMGGGTGLGLPIAKKLVEMMGGSITVTSEYQKGSVFTARFPQKFVTEAAIGPEVAENLKTFRYSDHKRRQRSRLARIDLSYARVLVVDDMPTNLDVTKGMMMPYGMQVDCVTSGQQAINAIRSEKVRYNAVFMDHMMPGMDGIEATRIIREDVATEYAQTVPIIALTANAIVGNEEMFLHNGFQAFLSKPIDMGRLDAVLREWVRNKKLEKAIAAKERMLKKTRRQNKERRGAPARKNGSDRRLLGEGIAGLDINRGIQRFGNEQSFLQILRSFATNTKPLLEELEQVQEDTLADYAIVVHGIKGSSRGVCADPVGDRAEALEQAAKSGDFDFVRANNPALLEAARQLVADIDKLLAKLAVNDAKPQKDKPDKEALARLFSGCKNNDMDEVDAAMEELEGYAYESDAGLVAWLRENVDQIHLSQIQEKLSTLPQ